MLSSFLEKSDYYVSPSGRPADCKHPAQGPTDSPASADSAGGPIRSRWGMPATISVQSKSIRQRQL